MLVYNLFYDSTLPSHPNQTVGQERDVGWKGKEERKTERKGGEGRKEKKTKRQTLDAKILKILANQIQQHTKSSTL